VSALKQLPDMVLAELVKIRRRGFGTVAVVVAAVHGALVLAAMVGLRALARWQAPASERNTLDLFDGLQVGEWTLFTLCLPVMTVVVLAVVAELFAGEYAQRTYSLLLIRPVPRWQVFAAKFIAVYGFVILLFAGAVLLTSVLGLVGFGASKATGARAADLAMGLGAEQSFGVRLGEVLVWIAGGCLGMLPVIAATAFFAVVTRSTALTVTYTIILLIIDAGVRLTFPLVGPMLEQDFVVRIADFTMTASRLPPFNHFLAPALAPSDVVGHGEYLKESLGAFALLFGYSAAFIGGAIAVFSLQDVE